MAISWLLNANFLELLLMNLNNEHETTIQLEQMSSGFSAKRQIQLKTEPGSVQSSVQLDGLISSTIQLKNKFICRLPPSCSLRDNNLQINTLASCSVKTERGVVEETIFALQESIVQIEHLTDCSVEIESGSSKITTSNFLDISIHFQDYSPLLPGDRITRMGRYGWNGRILQVEVNSVL